MIGDDRQLAAIDTGGAFRAFRLRLGACELRDNHRQRTQLGQDVAALLRNHRADEAMDQLVAHGKVIVCRSEAEANTAQVRDWWQRFRQGQQAGMIAFSRAEVARLNTAARDRMAQDGRLGPDALQIDEREFRIGDRIVCGRNARARLGVVNGTRGQVTALDPNQRGLTIRTDEGKTVRLPGWYVAGRGHDDQPWVDHGYAITGHKTQGLTGDDFGVRPSTGQTPSGAMWRPAATASTSACTWSRTWSGPLRTPATPATPSTTGLRPPCGPWAAPASRPLPSTRSC
jgi:ATP-dependent exoDNAse (exonuclease V) alpha subunit